MRAVQPSFHLIVALKPPDVLRVSLNPHVTFFGSLGSNLPAWVMNASTALPVSASTTLPKTPQETPPADIGTADLPTSVDPTEARTRSEPADPPDAPTRSSGRTPSPLVWHP